jgi:integrase/recombinase XerD
MKITDLIPEYIDHLKTLGRSERTVKGAGYDLRPFVRFLAQEEVFDLEALSADVMAEYQQELAFKLSVRGKLLSLRTQGQLLGVAKGFCRFLKEQDYLLHDPGAKIKLPRKPQVLPKTILTEEEVRRLVNAPDTRTSTGYRNRVIIEVLYNTAVRRSELVGIRLMDLDLMSGFILIRGKGSKERVVPLGGRVCELVKNYVPAVRPAFVRSTDPGYLILNRWGSRLSSNGVWAVVKRCAQLAGIERNITPHGLRHTCATHMLKNGAPVRHLQEMLGHESLESTQIYTRVTITDLKKIHARYHPGEKL